MLLITRAAKSWVNLMLLIEWLIDFDLCIAGDPFLMHDATIHTTKTLKLTSTRYFRVGSKFSRCRSHKGLCHVGTVSMAKPWLGHKHSVHLHRCSWLVVESKVDKRWSHCDTTTRLFVTQLHYIEQSMQTLKFRGLPHTLRNIST